MGSISQVWFWFIHIPFLGWIAAAVACLVIIFVIAAIWFGIAETL